jgi:hypothetical protein
VRPSGSRVSRPAGTPAGRWPALLLLGGIALAIAGVLLASFGVLLTFQPGGGPAGIFLAMQWIGILSVASGAVIVAVSIGWWLWRIARSLTR